MVFDISVWVLKDTFCTIKVKNVSDTFHDLK